MNTDKTYEVERRIIDAFESAFYCQPGPSVAYFDIPQRAGDEILSVRATYVVYAVTGQNLDDTETWFFEHVINPLIKNALAGGYLFWRNPERVSVDVRDVAKPQYVVRTRIAVLNQALEEVRINDAIKPAGEPTPEVEND